MKLIAGNSNQQLAIKIAEYLDTKLSNIVIDYFANTEVRVKIMENIRSEDIFILQTGGAYSGRTINDHIMEVFGLIDACRRSDAKSITLVMPCYAYARQDKKDGARAPITGSMMAMLYEKLGVTRVVAIDLHAGQIQGFFNIACDNLYANRLLSDHFIDTIFKGMKLDEIQEKYILVSPDCGGIKRIRQYSESFRLNCVMLDKKRDHSKKNVVNESILISDYDLKGKTAIIIDDMIDTAGTITAATDTLIKNHIDNIIIVFTHGILSGQAIDRINKCDAISKIIVTNTLAQDKNLERCKKLEVVDISTLLGETIKRIAYGGSVSELFETQKYFESE